MKTVNMPPDAATLMWSTRAIGYTTPAAVADLIDNSISAEASVISIEFISGEDGYVSILDNGKGMDYDALQNAMKYGSGDPSVERSSTDLGRFGLGLKTASLSQCRQLIVVSKKNSSINGFCWDLDYVFKVRQWDLIELEESEIFKLPQINDLLSLNEGTIVIWKNLDKMCAGDEDKEKGFLVRIKEVEAHIAITFHRYLQGEPGLKKINIKSNGIDIMPRDPFYISRSDPLPVEKIPIEYTNINGDIIKENVYVSPYILPFSDSITQEELDELGGKDGLIRNQGFYIYRNKRLIVAADWFRLTRKSDLTKLCRVKVDIPNSLDDLWTIDVKKSMAVPPEIILRNLRRIISPIVKAGKRKYSFRAVEERSNDRGIQLWIPMETRNGMMYHINPDYPIVKQLMQEAPDTKKMKVLLKLLEQNIPVNSIHTDFYDDKKYAFEDVDIAYQNAKNNLIDLLKQVSPEEREEEFNDLMTMIPFSEYEIKYSDLEGLIDG